MLHPSIIRHKQFVRQHTHTNSYIHMLKQKKYIKRKQILPELHNLWALCLHPTCTHINTLKSCIYMHALTLTYLHLLTHTHMHAYSFLREKQGCRCSTHRGNLRVFSTRIQSWSLIKEQLQGSERKLLLVLIWTILLAIHGERVYLYRMPKTKNSKSVSLSDTKNRTQTGISLQTHTYLRKNQWRSARMLQMRAYNPQIIYVYNPPLSWYVHIYVCMYVCIIIIIIDWHIRIRGPYHTNTYEYA